MFPPSSPRRLLCLGGSFNPIHNGHLILGRLAAEAAGFDHLLLIPSALPPHKLQNRDIAPASDRLAMCRLATWGSPLFAVDHLEIQRAGPSYTLDTVRQLKTRGWDEIHWLIGADMVPILPKWHRARELAAEASFLVMARPGWSLDWDSLPEEWRPLQQRVVPTPLLDISASQIRQRLLQGLPVDHFVPPAVQRYLHDHRLYQP